MSWSKIDDDYYTHEKVLRAGRDAAYLNLVAIAYASKHLTDGAIMRQHLPILAGIAQIEGDPKPLAAKLCEVGIWEETAEGWQIHGFLEWHKTAAKVKEDAAKNAADQATWRAAHAANGSRKPLTKVGSKAGYRVQSTEKEETNVSSRATGKPSRSRKPPWKQIISTHPLYEACAEAFGEPPNDGIAGKWKVGLELLMQSGATPETIAQRVANHQAMYASGVKGWLLENPNALALHWPDLESVTPPPGNGRTSPQQQGARLTEASAHPL